MKVIRDQKKWEKKENYERGIKEKKIVDVMRGKEEWEKNIKEGWERM